MPKSPGKGRVVERILIRPLEPEDLDDVVRIEAASFPEPWPREAFVAALESPDVAQILVAVQPSRPKGSVLGYACFWLVRSELHLANIAVDADYRRKGIATLLIERVEEAALIASARYVVLEVRSTNEPARALYEKLGFVKAGIDEGFYFDGEDADILVKRLI